MIIFGGLAIGLFAGIIWVVVGPWLPGRGLVSGRSRRHGGRVRLGRSSSNNPDFVVLDHDPLVVAMLVALVAAVGFSMALVDSALDRRLPAAVPKAGGATLAYAIVSLLGVALILPVALAILFDQSEYAAMIRVGWGLLAVGLCTLASWVLRVRGRPEPPRGLVLTARAALLVTVALAPSLPGTHPGSGRRDRLS